MPETPTLCELKIGALAQVEGVKCVVIDPAKGVVCTLVLPVLKFLRPSASVSHWGEANGAHITWKPFGSQENPPLTPAFEAFIKNTSIPGA